MVLWLRDQTFRPPTEEAADKLYAKAAQNTNNENDTIMLRTNKLEKKKEVLINIKERIMEISSNRLDFFVMTII